MQNTVQLQKLKLEKYNSSVVWLNSARVFACGLQFHQFISSFRNIVFFYSAYKRPLLRLYKSRASKRPFTLLHAYYCSVCGSLINLIYNSFPLRARSEKPLVESWDFTKKSLCGTCIGSGCCLFLVSKTCSNSVLFTWTGLGLHEQNSGWIFKRRKDETRLDSGISSEISYCVTTISGVSRVWQKIWGNVCDFSHLEISNSLSCVL